MFLCGGKVRGAYVNTYYCVCMYVSVGVTSVHNYIICTSHLVETSTFNSSTTKESFQIRHRLTCQSSNIVYLLYCHTCQQSQYVGETKNTLKTRFYQHRSHINKNTDTLVTKHFNQTDHSIHNMKCVAVEKVHSDKREDRLRREAFWIQKLKTVVPCGLNTLD